jgi:hypothetical protein
MESNNNEDNINQNINSISTQKDLKENQSEIKETKNLKLEISSNSNQKENKAEEVDLPSRASIKRSNSIKLYKKQQKDKHKKDIINKEEIKNDNIYNASIKKGTKRAIKIAKKKVAFLPNFLTIINVESYKKFNEENTCKDPFDNIENINNINIPILNGSDDVKIEKNKKDDDEHDGKARLQCSCYIF